VEVLNGDYTSCVEHEAAMRLVKHIYINGMNIKDKGMVMGQGMKGK